MMMYGHTHIHILYEMHVDVCLDATMGDDLGNLLLQALNHTLRLRLRLSK